MATHAEHEAASRLDGIYVSAFDMWCDCGSYAEVARQLGVAHRTAKRYVLLGAEAVKRERDA